MNFRKENEIRVFGSAMKNNSENNFWYLVIFWKYYFPTKFSHFLVIFSASKQVYNKKFQYINLKQTKIKTKPNKKKKKNVR